MANNRINRYIGAVALGTALMIVPGCTDTWDDHYDDGSTPETTTTLWERIKSNPEYSRFADIVQRAKYYNDTRVVSDYTYEDILSGGQVNTIWVPDNSVLTKEEYEKWLQMCTSGSASDGYNVQQQFLGNHIALWRHNVSGPGIDTVKMINGKNLIFDKTARSLQDIPLGTEYNVPAVNGVMHALRGIAPFRYNFYEYLKYSEPLTEFGKYVVGKDTTYFFAEASIEGLPDVNGNPTYVDSVYRTSNRLFEGTIYLPDEGKDKWLMAEEGFGAPINNEDSVFVMLLPTDDAWNAAYEKLKASYKYATIYDDKSKGDLNASNTAIKGLDPDSLQDMSIKMDLISPLVFNLHKQPKREGEMWTLDMFKEYKGDGVDLNNPKSYLLNTFGDTLRAVGDWKPSDLFNVEPEEMSNGIAYAVTSWNFPSQFYTPDVEVEIENSGIFYNTASNKYKVGTDTKKISFSNSAYGKITSIYGHVSNNNFYHLDAPGPTSVPKAEFKLFGNNPNAYVPNAQVMSGKYDIQVVMVPRWYLNLSNASGIPDVFYEWDIEVNPEDETDITYTVTDQLDFEYIEELASNNKYKFRTQISYNNDATKDKTSSWVNSTYDGLKVDTITVAKDFEFPYSYKNIRNSYPTLIFEGTTGKNDAKNGYVYDIVIDKIILKRTN